MRRKEKKGVRRLRGKGVERRLRRRVNMILQIDEGSPPPEAFLQSQAHPVAPAATQPRLVKDPNGNFDTPWRQISLLLLLRQDSLRSQRTCPSLWQKSLYRCARSLAWL
mmetsp:Transcript_44844/g.88514  ORF Transcript_44844/g.88514 Transcript_44844/m.88514 type:complete len:109 (-) Transcript_44844:227-553(-)